MQGYSSAQHVLKSAGTNQAALHDDRAFNHWQLLHAFQSLTAALASAQCTAISH